MMQDVLNHPSGDAIQIGLIGPEELLSRIQKVLQTFPSFKAVSRSYENEEEAPSLAKEMMDKVEVLLISGPMPYRRIREEVSFSIPVHYVPLTDTGFYRALLRLNNQLGVTRSLQISIDSVGYSMVDKALRDIEEYDLQVVHYDKQAYPSSQELIDFHKYQVLNGKCQAALTAERSVAMALQEANIPCEWIIPTDQNIVVALERALLSTETRKMKEAQIVVGLLNVDHFNRHTKQHASEHEIQKFKLDIHRMLLDYVESLDGYLTHQGADEYLFFTTRGIFERETGGSKSIPVAKKASTTLGLTFSIGIGFGRSANEAGTHARLALRKCKEAGGNTCFIVREDQTLIGPLEMSDQISYDLSLTDPQLLKRAEEAGMTSEYLSRLLTQAAKTGKIDYKVHELSDLLDITTRSTHRLLQQWIDFGLVHIVGMEKVPKGRPRQIFQFSFLKMKVEK